MKRKTYLSSLLLILSAALLIACSSNGDDDAVPGSTAIVPDPAMATAQAGETQSSVILIGGTTFQFFPANCEIDGTRFTVNGRGTEGGDPFDVEVSGDAATDQVDVVVDVTPATPTAGAENISASYQTADEPARIEIDQDARSVEIETQLVDMSLPAGVREPVDSKLTLQCGD